MRKQSTFVQPARRPQLSLLARFLLITDCEIRKSDDPGGQVGRPFERCEEEVLQTQRVRHSLDQTAQNQPGNVVLHSFGLLFYALTEPLTERPLYCPAGESLRRLSRNRRRTDE